MSTPIFACQTVHHPSCKFMMLFLLFFMIENFEKWNNRFSHFLVILSDIQIGLKNIDSPGVFFGEKPYLHCILLHYGR